ncbi:MAG: choice-of-anchor B family protein, partial [Rubricoccaceae bacterium]|nr:choice-of-anchor B family protein [Rubricoccaceae bacterium]
PNGDEYALMGVLDGIAVVAIPSQQVIGTIPGPTNSDPYYHRDMVVHGEYAYAVTECTGAGEGLQVIDLSNLPDSVSLVDTFMDSVVSSHNMDVDQGTGFLYVLNSNASGVAIIDASDPEHLKGVNLLNLPNVHDVHARNDTLYVAEGWEPTFSIWDVSNKLNPQMLARVTIPNAGYVHNIWPTDDGRHVMTTEETEDKTVKVWDISDMSDVTLVGEWLGPNDLAHNVHIQGDYAYLSHYAAGVIVLDISDIEQPVEVARYDTLPEHDNPGFRGNWGATVPSPNGYVYGGDFDGTLSVLQFQTPVANEPGATSNENMLVSVYPNPSTGEVRVRYELGEAMHSRLAVYDLLGREIASLADGEQQAGTHILPFETTDLPSGVYVIRLDAGGRTETQRLSLVR